MGAEHYLHSATEQELELDRLRLLASVFDPVTIRHLETIGVSEGWKCLEVGAGEGSIARWLLNRVCSGGKVVATDIDMRYLRRLSAPNLEIRRHDILKDDIEEGEYDLVHCRLLLMHLPEQYLSSASITLNPLELNSRTDLGPEAFLCAPSIYRDFKEAATPENDDSYSLRDIAIAPRQD